MQPSQLIPGENVQGRKEGRKAKEKDERKKVKEDKGKKGNCKGKGSGKGKKGKTFFVACSDSLQRRKFSQANIVSFEELTLSHAEKYSKQGLPS